MKSKRTFLIAIALVIGMLIGSGGLAIGVELIDSYEPDPGKFERIEYGDKIIYNYRRMIGEAIVEKDAIVYQFDKDTEELIEKITRWRDDLPEQLPEKMITKEGAESMVGGEVQSSTLYFISPESDVFPIKPTPENPCWVVRSIENEERIITIIDAVEGKNLGNGVPPPYTAFSLSGPQYNSPCSGTWTSWYTNAEDWFDDMGYSTEAVQWPTQAKVQSHVQSTQTAMFYELAHGGSTSFSSGCVGGQSYENTTASEIETWISSYMKMPFAFIGSCGGMCSTGDNTLSYEFRKGSTANTATVGYCGMADWQCDDCWPDSVDWQDRMFYRMNQGWTVKAAYDDANTQYPDCMDDSHYCMRFAGDQNFVTKPLRSRDGYPLLELHTPTVNGMTVTQNGVTYPGCGNIDMSWCNANTCGPNPNNGPFKFIWGDGGTSCSYFPCSHTYSSSGTYNIRVQVTNTCGYRAERNRYVTVP